MPSAGISVDAPSLVRHTARQGLTTVIHIVHTFRVTDSRQRTPHEMRRVRLEGGWTIDRMAINEFNIEFVSNATVLETHNCCTFRAKTAAQRYLQTWAALCVHLCGQTYDRIPTEELHVLVLERQGCAREVRQTGEGYMYH